MDACTQHRWAAAHRSSDGDQVNAEADCPHLLRSLLDRFQTRTANGLKGPIAPAARRLPLSIPSGARFEERVFANEAGSRAYKLYVPSSYKGQALPLVVMLHGCTQSPDDFAAGTRMNELAEEQTFFVAYPEQLQAANASKCWNWFSTNDQKRGRGEPSLIAGITRQVMSEFPGHFRSRVYCWNVCWRRCSSNHGFDVSGPICSYWDSFRIGLRGSQRSSLRLLRNAPRKPFRKPGHRDKQFQRSSSTAITTRPSTRSMPPRSSHSAKPCANLQTTVNQGSTAGGLSYTRVVQADENGRPVLEQWTVHGVGHAWSGGSVAGSYTEPRGPDASREMLRFFLEQRPGSSS